MSASEFVLVSILLLVWILKTAGKNVGVDGIKMNASFLLTYLELKAAILSQQSLCDSLCDSCVCIELGNPPAVFYIHLDDSKSSLCNATTKQFFQIFAYEIVVTAIHIPELENCVAAEHSRLFNDQTELALNHTNFHKV